MNSQENDQQPQLELPLFRRRKSATFLMPLIIGADQDQSSSSALAMDEQPGTSSLELGPVSPFKSPTATLSPNLIFERHRRLSTSSRSSYGAGSGLGSSSDTTDSMMYYRVRCSPPTHLDTLPTETLEDRIGRWMLWASESEKRWLDASNAGKPGKPTAHEDLTAERDEKEHTPNGDNSLEIPFSGDYISSSSPIESPSTTMFMFYAEENADSSCKLSF